MFSTGLSPGVGRLVANSRLFQVSASGPCLNENSGVTPGHQPEAVVISSSRVSSAGGCGALKAVGRQWAWRGY
jgi:hypothetical protein